MKQFRLAKISLAALILASTTSFAEPRTTGAYGELNVGTLYQSINFFGFHFHAFNSAGVNSNVGYQLSRYFALEGGYTYYGSSLNSLDVAAKVILPFQLGNQDFNVFAKIGPAFLFRKGDHAVLPYGGLGAGYSINKNLDLTVQAQGVTNGFFDLGLVSLGLAYHF